jgi:hypothetical protein
MLLVDENEAQRLLELLKDAIARSGRSRREIERALGWSQGYLGSILRGRIALKVWHVFDLARELGREPLSFFLTVAPPRDPNWILEQLGIPPPGSEEPGPEPVAPGPPLSREELEDLVRVTLREELEKIGADVPAYFYNKDLEPPDPPQEEFEDSSR